MIVLNLISKYKFPKRGADGTVDMWDSKSHAERRASSSLALPTINNLCRSFVLTTCRSFISTVRRVRLFKRKEWIYFLVNEENFLLRTYRSLVVVCRNTTIPCLNKVYRA